MDPAEFRRHGHELVDWMTRTATPPAAREEVRCGFAGASPVFRRAFAVEYDNDGVPVAFWDHKALFACTK